MKLSDPEIYSNFSYSFILLELLQHSNHFKPYHQYYCPQISRQARISTFNSTIILKFQQYQGRSKWFRNGQPDFLPQTPPPHFVFTNFSPVAIIGTTASPKPRRHRVPDPGFVPRDLFSRDQGPVEYGVFVFRESSPKSRSFMV
jgi:hypothetical protein